MQPRVDALLTLKDHIAGYATLLKGDFEKDIAELKALKKDVDAKSALVDTVQKLEDQKKQADAYVVAKFDEAEKVKANAEAFVEALKKKEAALKERDESLAMDINAFEKQKAADSVELDTTAKALAAREKAISALESKQEQRAKELASIAEGLAKQQSDLNTKLATLKQLAA